MSNDNNFGAVLFVGALILLVLLMLAPSHEHNEPVQSEHASIEKRTNDNAASNVATQYYLWNLQRTLMSSTQRGSANYSGMSSFSSRRR